MVLVFCGRSMDKGLSILIIGGSGYAGQNLVRRAAERFQVSWTYYKNLLPEMPVNAFRLDIRYFKQTQELITKIKPPVIYHLAYDSEDLYGTVTDGTNNLIHNIPHEKGPGINRFLALFAFIA